MASPRDNKFLRVSNELSKGTTSKSAPSTVSKYLYVDDPTDFSPAVLETSQDEGRHPQRRRKPRSHSWSPSETDPILFSGQSNEQDAGQSEESGTNRCCSTIDCLKNSIIKFRNSAFIYIVLLVFSAIPVSAIVMGLIFAENCPKVHFLPVFGAVIGAIGAIFMAFWMFVSCANRRGMPCSNRQALFFGVTCFLVLVLTTLDAVFVGSLSPSFDPESAEFCNETFYTYAFYKEIATAVAVVLSAILYLPGSRHILCCHDCSMRSTPSAFYVSI